MHSTLDALSDTLKSFVVKKVSYNNVLRFSAFSVVVSKELTESELRQFYLDLKHFETAVGEQLGDFASVIRAPSLHAQASKENMVKILQYAEGKQLFRAGDIQLDLSLFKDSVYQALTKLVADKKLTRFKLRPGGAYGYTLAKRAWLFQQSMLKAMTPN